MQGVCFFRNLQEDKEKEVNPLRSNSSQAGAKAMKLESDHEETTTKARNTNEIKKDKSHNIKG